MGLFRTRADAILDLQRQIVELRGVVDDVRDKHERLRGAFYQARQGLAADGETPIAPRGRGRPRGPTVREETRDEFRARMQAAMQGQRPARPPDDTQ